MAVILFVVLSLLLKELEIETFQILYKVTFVKWSLRFVDSWIPEARPQEEAIASSLETVVSYTFPS